MKIITKVLLASGSFLLVGALAVHASTFDQETKLTFNKPVEVPGMILPAGTYTFTKPLASTPYIVRVWNANHTRAITTILGIPHYRFHAPGKTIIKFREMPAKSPQALKAWFYPGFNTGVEFVYPMNRERELAQLNDTHMPAAAKATSRQPRAAHRAS